MSRTLERAVASSGSPAANLRASTAKSKFVVLLTDGNDTASRTKMNEVLAPLRAHSENEGVTVRVFTIAYGENANESVLDDVANASGGKPFGGDPGQIRTVYKTIASFF